MSWKPTIKVFGEAPYYTNGQTFATEDEARKSARNRYGNWTQAEAYGVEESDEPVSYRWDDEVGDIRIGDK